LSRRAPPNPMPGEDGPGLSGALRALVSSRESAYATLGLFVSGATTMLFEIVFVRVLGLVFGVSSYAFSLVLAVFLLGLALGSLLATRLARRRAPRLLDFAAAEVGTALAAAALLAALPLVPRLILYARQIPEAGFVAITLFKGAVATVFLLPLALVAGLAVPFLLGALAGELKSLGRVVGDAYLVNTAGTVVGSLATGFVLIPALGTEGSLRLAIGVCLATGAAGLVLLSAGRRERLLWGAGATAAAILAVLLPAWPKAIFLRSDALLARVFTTKAELEARLANSPHELLFFREGRNGTVAVTQAARGRSLLVGAHPDASDSQDMSTQVFLGVIPLAIHPKPEDVLVAGGADPRLLAPVLEKMPDAASGFPQNERLMALAVLQEQSGRFEDAVASCVGAENGGLLDASLLAVHVRCLKALGRSDEEQRVLARLLRITPHAILEPLVSPFAAGAR
jgi:spermidine synthase